MKKEDDKYSLSEHVMKLVNRPLIVAVIGAGECEKPVYDQAYQVGREIAIRGGIVVCGGLEGVMEAACKGAKEAGGSTVGILPGRSIEDCNDYVDTPIATGMGIARNSIIAHTGRVAIAIAGQYGTLSEIAYFLQLKKKVVGLGTWDLETEVIKAKNPIEAVDMAFDGIV